VVRRHELTEAAWEQIQPLLPPPGRPGSQWADHRRVLNGILWKLATGVPWRDLPERYGPWQTCYERLRRWQTDGTWDRLLAPAALLCARPLDQARAAAVLPACKHPGSRDRFTPV
jgi:transposase